MDNLLAGILTPHGNVKNQNSWVIPRVIAPFYPLIQGWQTSPEWVAAFKRNRWQLCAGIGGRIGPEYTAHILK